MKAYLFDFDGTLVDSMPTYVSAMFRILDENKISYTNEIVKKITPLGIPATAEYYIHLGVPSTKEALVARMKAYMLDAYLYSIPAKDHVVSTLRSLKEGGAKLSVLTASPHTILDPCLTRLGIFEVFDHIWSCDDFGITKAEPGIYQAASERIGEDIGDILFLDDNFNAVKTAKAAGMQVCGVYDPTSETYIAEMKAISDYYIWDLGELLHLA